MVSSTRRRPIHSGTAGIVAPTLNVGLIKGGINTNVVPDQVVFRIDRRVIPEENPAEVEAELRELIGAPSTLTSGSLPIPRILDRAAFELISAITWKLSHRLRTGATDHPTSLRCFCSAS